MDSSSNVKLPNVLMILRYSLSLVKLYAGKLKVGVSGEMCSVVGSLNNLLSQSLKSLFVDF